MAASDLHQPRLLVPFAVAEPSLRIPAPAAVGWGGPHAVGLNCRLVLWLDVGGGRPPRDTEFVVDSGASLSLIDLALAVRQGIPVPPAAEDVEIPFIAAGGTSRIRVRPGRIRCWWAAARTGWAFDWPVLFRVGSGPRTPPLLGLGGVVGTCRWTFDGPTPDAPFGALTLDDTR